MSTVDELAARRAAKAAAAKASEAAAVPLRTPLEAIEHGDYLLCDLVTEISGELLVDAERVRQVAREVDRILLGLRNLELEREAR